MSRRLKNIVAVCCLVLLFPVVAVRSNAFPNSLISTFNCIAQGFADSNIVARWSMDRAAYDGNYIDSVAGYIARPNGEPNFITGIRNEPNGAVMINLSGGWGLSKAFRGDLSANGFTVCFWGNWNGNWEGSIDVNELIVTSSSSGTEYALTDGMRADGAWRQVCITYDNSTIRVYLNGRLNLSESVQLPAGSEAVIEIGNSIREQIFSGAIDDIRIYNYPLSQTDITQLVTGLENCIQQYSLEYDFWGPYGLPDCIVNLYDLDRFIKFWLDNCPPGHSLEFDFSGPGGLLDCVVNFYDLAEFAKHWLESGLSTI